MATASFNARLDRINKKGPGTYIAPGPAHDAVRYGAAVSRRSNKPLGNWTATLMGGFFGVGTGMYYALVMADVMPWTIDLNAFGDMLQAEQIACGLVGLSLPLMLFGILVRRFRPGIMSFSITYLMGMIAAYFI